MSASSDVSNNDTSAEDISPIEQVMELFVDLRDLLSSFNGSSE